MRKLPNANSKKVEIPLPLKQRYLHIHQINETILQSRYLDAFSASTRN